MLTKMLMCFLLLDIAANAAILTFEDLPDAYYFNGGGQNIGGFYSGVALGSDVTGLSVSRFGGYDNMAYPPHSGDVVIWDATDNTVTIDFASPITSFSIWYTSLDPLLLQAFDVGSSALGMATGNPNTDGTTGTSSLLSFAASGISSITLTGSAGQFVLDDLTYELQQQSTIPEPAMSLPLLLIVAALWRVGKRYSV